MNSERPLALALPKPTPGHVPTQAPSHRAIVGTSDVWQYVMFRVAQVASTNATVLVLGETGTGKELVARAIHDQSHRRQQKFVAVNCGGLPGSLIESELFGRERGAFTGAYTSQAGRFEFANGGTIFLDEIGELPFDLQSRLLRVLQDGQIERLGSTRTVTADVRVIAATNKDLAEAVRNGTFRQDLFYRLNVFPITLPALRDRQNDLPALIDHLADCIGRQMGKAIHQVTPGSVEALQRYHWPGNIRELANVIQQAVILSRNGVLDLANFPDVSTPRGAPDPVLATPAVASVSRLATLAEVQRTHILRVLARTNWRIEGKTGAASTLGLCASTLRSRMRRLGIVRPDAQPRS